MYDILIMITDSDRRSGIPAIFFPAMDAAEVVPQVPFREGHGIAGQCVALAEKHQCQLTGLALKDLQNIWCVRL